MSVAAHISKEDRIGLARTSVDAHALGLTSVAQLLADCGYRTVLADAATCTAFGNPDDPALLAVVVRWLREKHITILGFSYRLDPHDGFRRVVRLVEALKSRRLLKAQGGQIKAIYFAGLPKTCELVRRNVHEVAAAFDGDDTPSETLRTLGVESAAIPSDLIANTAYDENRLAFGRDLIRSGAYQAVAPVDRSSYPEFGTRNDTLLRRLTNGAERNMPPLMRAHVGPYLPDRDEAVRLFFHWCQQLAGAGFLDILSIGTSQLTQSNFGEDWGDKPNGGGVPLNSSREFSAAWQVSRPMLVRTYAGTRDVAVMARMYEETINIAWHALSLWWFCRIDGRGPYSLRENLDQHFDALRYIATTGKPYEPNVAHHFAFRGADDVTCVVASVLAARSAKAAGIRNLVLQLMLNTPRATWGLQDLAKARATLSLVRELEDRSFRVILQPRGGLDYFSPNREKAKAQLAAVTALMDDIEPLDSGSPPLIHVVSYSEGSDLATPAVIDESIKITRHALESYRRLRKNGEVADMARDPDVAARTQALLTEARTILQAIEATLQHPYTAEGLYQAFAMGFLAAPFLWECRDELAKAAMWQTRLISGSVKVVDESGIPIPADERMKKVLPK